MKTVTLTAAAMLLCAASVSAQNTGHKHPAPPENQAPRPARANDVHQHRPQSRAQARPKDAQRRDALEQRFRQRSEQIVRSRLRLDEQQATRLRSVNADIGGKRNALVDQERAVRSDLRNEMKRGGAADQGRVSQLMEQAHDLQVKRFQLQHDEQEQLSRFMSPMQVAQYVGLQAQIRQRIREMQRKNDGNPPDPEF